MHQIRLSGILRPMMSGLRIAMVSLALVVAMSACALTIKPDVPKPVTGGVRFTYFAPTANTVYVVGSFNGWVKGATLMKREGQTGVWIAEVMLLPGEHTFMYLVDGKEWVAPPLAEDFVTDGFGQTNGVVIVR
ncbi:MAG: isoamylase early set domain-containing protein [Nitrospirota bacterium]